MCHGSGRIGTTDWLIKGMTEEELVKKTEEALADIVEVVRCKDCKHWKRNVGFADSPNGHCFCHEIDTNGFDFCSYGERKN